MIDPSTRYASIKQGLLLAAVLCASAWLQACGGGGGGSSPAPTPAPPPSGSAPAHRLVYKASADVPTSACPNGGARIESGFDVNNNGVLDASEITATQFVCNGTNGGNGTNGTNGGNGSNGANGSNALVSSSVEPAGAHCATGGYKVDVGLDSNANGTLDAAEVTSTQYVCNGANGSNGTNGTNGSNGTNGTNGVDGINSLMAIVNEAAGANCTYGGRKITAGPDSNRNNTLDAAEVTTTTFLCNGPPAGLAWQQVVGAVQAVPNTGYLADGANQVTINLPLTPALGDVVGVNGMGAGGWLIKQNAGQSINTENIFRLKNWQARDASRNWNSVASSADSSKLVATDAGNIVARGGIYTSSDAGISWTQRIQDTGLTKLPRPVASSSDGVKLVADAGGSAVLVSKDSGVSWISVPLPAGTAIQSLASSADGSRLVLGADFIYTSSDSGLTWVASLRSTANWRSVASSSDGKQLVAAPLGGAIHTSVDGGIKWTTTLSGVGSWSSVASSADGSKLVAAIDSGQIYTSSDGGVNWVARESNRAWVSVASSADGRKLVAAVKGGQIFTSTDSGANWSPRDISRGWNSVASSADGSKVVGVVSGGQIFTSTSQTTTGTTGFIAGLQFDAIMLQFMGGGLWSALSHEGDLTFE